MKWKFFLLSCLANRLLTGHGPELNSDQRHKQATAHLDFNDVDGIPAAFDLVRTIARLLHQYDTGEAGVKVPQVD